MSLTRDNMDIRPGESLEDAIKRYHLETTGKIPEPIPIEETPIRKEIETQRQYGPLNYQHTTHYQ
ncbi:MAG: hypothetical protein ACQESG_04965 [Nanobdellota archaeon]